MKKNIKLVEYNLNENFMKKNEELLNLRTKILKFNEEYEKGTPLVEDVVYDFYKKKLALLEQHQKIKVSDYIGSKVIGKTEKHLFPILSLEHDFAASSINKFIQKIEKTIDPFPLIGELKIDGISLIARYKNSEIVSLKTRGDGFFGEDISHLIPFSNIPNNIYLQEELEIRFEAYFDKDICKNPRNAAAGILLKKKPDEKLPLLKFAPHNLYSSIKIWDTYTELRNIFKKMHLDCIEPYSICNSLEDCIKYFKEINHIKKDLTHEIDGVVFKVDSKIKQDILGNTAKAPKFSFAVKFENSFNISEIEKIDFQVGRNGKITPVAIITPTIINNRTISKATLNNLKDLKKKKYSIGDIVKVEMAGEVIPKITEIIEKSKSEIFIPNQCPSCQSVLINETCQNNWKCYEQKLNKLIYFAGKEGLNIKNFGETQIEFFVKEKVITYPFDFFELKNNIHKLSTFPNWLGSKSLNKIIENIEKSKYTTLERFITSIGLPNIAKTKAKEISNHFKSFENFMSAKIEDLKFLGKTNALAICEYKNTESKWIKKTASYLKIEEKYQKKSLFDF